MLRRLGLNNFKAFERLEGLDLKRLTVLCGPNAVGKSSIIQSLLALKQTAEQAGLSRGEHLLLSGDVVDLGNIESVVYRHDRDRPIRVAFSLSDESDDFELAYSYTAMRFKTDAEADYRIPIVSGLEFRGGVYLSPGDSTPTSIRVGLTLDTREETRDFVMEISAARAGDIVFRQEWDVEAYFSGLDIHEIAVDLVDEGTGEWAGELIARNIGSTGEAPTFERLQCERQELLELALHELSRAIYETRLLLHGSDYVGPNRDAPSHEYIRPASTLFSRQPKAPWHGRLTRDPERYTEHLPLPGMIGEVKNAGDDSESVTVDEALGDWLAFLGLPAIRASLETNSYQVLVDSPYAPGCPVTVADTGYGLSQVLPILLAGLDNPTGMLICDQPELHLNPKLQTGIADFLALVATRRRQVVVETHSDHFVNRLVRRIVEGAVSEDDVAIYFLSPQAEGPRIERVRIDPLFGIRNWPVGFFDQYVDEQEAILRASLNRRVSEGLN